MSEDTPEARLAALNGAIAAPREANPRIRRGSPVLGLIESPGSYPVPRTIARLLEPRLL